MGNASSFQEEEVDRWWAPETVSQAAETPAETSGAENTRRSPYDNTEMEQFHAELAAKRDMRREILAERKKEVMALRKENAELKRRVQSTNTTADDEELTELRQKAEETDRLTQLNRELRLDLSNAQRDLQEANAQIASIEQERREYSEHVIALKNVIQVSKQLINLRENQIEELRVKITAIEEGLAEREAGLLSTDLRAEYERQLRNIKALRDLYEQRQTAARAERNELAGKLAETDASLQVERANVKELQERVEELEKDVSEKYDTISNQQSQLGLSRAECRELQQELSVINQMFSQILLGFNNCQEVNLDKMVHLLEENHDLLTSIAGSDPSDDTSAMTKVLLDLVNKANESEKSADGSEKTPPVPPPLPSVPGQMNSAEKIVDTLPKVWKVLTELLSQQNGPQPSILDGDGVHPCYKSVDTPKGPKLVLSVSQTFIHLKDLILEKKSLEKEMTRLKQLNTHLEGTLQDQERRLEAVLGELGRTWRTVERMQKQHEQLHTHEKILRYELAQKRKLLTELKGELQYCREKWVLARQKNSSTEQQWQQLRAEFALRKTALADDPNNSAESGYSDEREGSSDDESARSHCPGEGDGGAAADADVADAPAEVPAVEEVTAAETDATDVTTDSPGAPRPAPSPPTPEEEEEPQRVPAAAADSEGASSAAQAGPPGAPTASTSGDPQEAALARREARLRRLEEQCQQLVHRVTNTSTRGEQICSKLQTLHEQYGPRDPAADN